MKINEVDPRNFDSDIDYYNALNAKPKARVPSEPRPSPAQQAADDEDAISQQRQSAHKAFTQKRAVKYVDKEGSAPNGKEYNKLYVIQAQDSATADHEEYMFDKNEWGAKKVVDVEKSKNPDGSVTHTLYIVDNHKYGLWKPWKDKPAIESSQNSFNHKPDDWSEEFERRMKQKDVKEFAPAGRDPWGNDDEPGDDPYSRPDPKHYSRSIDYFGQFEADHFDREDMNDATGEFKGYWDYDGKLKQIAYFKFDNPKQAGSDDPGMGWYYEPNEDSGAGASVKPAVDTSAQRKQQELGMIDAFLKSGQKAKPGSQIYSLMKKHGLAEAGPAQGEYSRVLTALRLYYPRFEIEELNTPDWHRVIANKANVTPEYAGQVIDDFVKASQPDEEENLDWMDDTNDVREGVAEATNNPTDVICVDVPLFIRLMEYAREDANTDMDLHDVAERLIRLSAEGETVSMSSYDEIVGSQKEIKEADMDLEQGRKNILSILKAAEQGQDAEIMVGNEPITLEYPEARFVGGRYKSFLKAGRQEEFLRALTDARAFDRIMIKMRAVLDKQKNFRGSVPGERGVEEGSGLDRYRQRVQSQGFTDSPEERNADRLERKRRHQDALNRISDIGGGSSDEERAHQAQQRMARDEYKLDRLKRSDDDWDKTFDMMRDRLNRYQWSSQRDVDPEQLAAISNIKYEPRKKNEAVQAKTDDNLRAYYAKRKAEAEKKKKEQGVEEDAPALAKFAGGLGLGALAAAGAPAIVGILGPLLGIPMAAYGAYSAAKLGMKGVEKLWDAAAEKLGGDDKVEQYTKSKIASLPPEQAQAAKAVIKQVAESRRSMAPAVNEGVVDAVKAGAKKAFKALTGPDDEELLQRLEKETGGKRPEKKDNEKVKESAPPGFDQDLEKKLLKQYKDNPERAYATMWTIHNKQKNENLDRALVNASAQLKENEYFCMLDKRVKQIPEGYKRTSSGYIIRK